MLSTMNRTALRNRWRPVTAAGLIALLAWGRAAGQDRDYVSDPLTAERCLQRAFESIHADRYAEAGDWFRRVKLRASNSQLQREAESGLEAVKLLGKPAPELQVMEWVVGKPVRLGDLRGRVVLVDMFQVISDEHLEAKPRIAALAGAHASRGLTVLGLAVAYEHQELQRPAWIKTWVEDHDFAYPVAIDAGLTQTFEAYGGRRVPQIALIDRDGRLRWLGVFRRELVENKLVELLDENPRESRLGVPESRGGRELVGKPAPKLEGRQWLNTPDGRAPDFKDRPYLLRFWTDGCRHCSASAAALNQIHEDYAGRGLLVVGIYHPKPAPREVLFGDVRRAAERLKLKFPLMTDNRWTFLTNLWLDTGRRDFTSASFLVDRRGVIRFVHPGPAFFPSDESSMRRQNKDYRALRQAIEAVLSE